MLLTEEQLRKVRLLRMKLGLLAEMAARMTQLDAELPRTHFRFDTGTLEQLIVDNCAVLPEELDLLQLARIPVTAKFVNHWLDHPENATAYRAQAVTSIVRNVVALLADLNHTGSTLRATFGPLPKPIVVAGTEF
jgi:hypothetical protein